MSFVSVHQSPIRRGQFNEQVVAEDMDLSKIFHCLRGGRGAYVIFNDEFATGRYLSSDSPGSAGFDAHRDDHGNMSLTEEDLPLSAIR